MVGRIEGFPKPRHGFYDGKAKAKAIIRTNVLGRKKYSQDK